MARYFPKDMEFRIYTVNAYREPHLFREDSHTAIVQNIKAKKMFVMKSKYCLECSKMADYYCEPTKKWLF